MRRPATQHLVQESSLNSYYFLRTYQTPPVDSLIVANTLDDLRRQVLGRTTERERLGTFRLISLHTLLAESEVSNLQVAVAIEQNILRFQISVDNTILVEAADRFDQLGSVEASPTLRKFSLLPQMVEKFTTIQEVHDEVKLCFGLKCVVKLHDERAIDLLQDVTLSYTPKTLYS